MMVSAATVLNDEVTTVVEQFNQQFRHMAYRASGEPDITSVIANTPVPQIDQPMDSLRALFFPVIDDARTTDCRIHGEKTRFVASWYIHVQTRLMCNAPVRFPCSLDDSTIQLLARTPIHGLWSLAEQTTLHPLIDAQSARLPDLVTLQI